VSFISRVREIISAIRSAKFPPPPKRRYDLIGEPIGGKGRIRDGGVTADREDETSRKAPDGS
jgi:hypothetical protein